MSKELGNGFVADYKEGTASLTAFEGALEFNVHVAKLFNIKLDEVVAKFESGEIDLIKGTDLDKVVALQILALLKTEINK